MKRADGVTTLCVGVIAGAVFLLSLYFSRSLLLPFAPFLVLGMAGFAYGFHTAVRATLAASVLVLLFAAGEGAVGFVCLFGFPTLIFFFSTVRLPQYAVGRALSWVSVYAAALTILVAVFAAGMDGGLEAVVLSYLDKILPMIEPELAPEFEARFHAYPYVFLAIPVTYLIIACYGVMWLARYLVVLSDGKPRPGVGILPFTPPLMLPGLLLITLLVAFSGDPEVIFTAKAVFLILLLPYFLSGLSLLHHASRNWAGRFWILMLLYLGITMSPWVLAAVATFGVVDHARGALKKKE